MEFLITVISGIAVGLALGLTGGGGSNFAVPLLIYVVGLAPAQAVPVSLAAVAMVAAAGAAHAITARLITWQPTLVFGAAGMLGAPLGLMLAEGVDDQLIIAGFAMLALAVGSSMAWRAWRYPQQAAVVRALPEHAEQDSGPVCRLADNGQLRFTAPCSVALAVAGLGTGLLAGFFGVGGGFIIVPALMLITRIGIHSAVATSLVVIAMTGMTGAAYATLQGSMLWSALLPFVGGGLLGMLLGRRLAARLAGPSLQLFFAVAVVTVALAMLFRTLVF